jgi:NAD(P)-dependent dehydrogenase (short-subunit alcohol dehydrogenase family)
VCCCPADVTKYEQVREGQQLHWRAATAKVVWQRANRCPCVCMPPWLQVVAAVQGAEAAHGPVDILICCAGAAHLGANWCGCCRGGGPGPGACMCCDHTGRCVGWRCWLITHRHAPPDDARAHARQATSTRCPRPRLGSR